MGIVSTSPIPAWIVGLRLRRGGTFARNVERTSTRNACAFSNADPRGASPGRNRISKNASTIPFFRLYWRITVSQRFKGVVNRGTLPQIQFQLTETSEGVCVVAQLPNGEQVEVVTITNGGKLNRGHLPDEARKYFHYDQNKGCIVCASQVNFVAIDPLSKGEQ